MEIYEKKIASNILQYKADSERAHHDIEHVLAHFY